MTALIETDRCRLRPLTEADATETYLSWFRDDETARNLSTPANTQTIDSIRAFIRERAGREDILFLGIFAADSGAHIGNIKYEPVDAKAGYAVMGILIGDPAWRGKGIAQEVLRASAAWLKSERGIRQILLGVSPDNPAAVRAYEGVGFRVGTSPYLAMPDPRLHVMVWDLYGTLPRED